MKNTNAIFAVCAGALILMAGCNRTEQTDNRAAPPAAPQAQSPAPQSTAPQSPPATPTAPMPAPDAPKGEAPEPKPGQANDHSNPEFKAGGKEVRK